MTAKAIFNLGHRELCRSLDEFRQVFYIRNMTETSYRTVEEVPEIYRDSWRSFLLLILIENVILYCRKKPTVRLNDGITSLSHAVFQQCERLLFGSTKNAAYIYIYNTYRLTDLPWNSPVTWCVALLSADFAYYWAHRSSHEVNIFWAQHQVHHSSEEFNIPVGLRQSIFQEWCFFVFYLPVTLFVPPAHLLAHQQFNFVYQIWIHTKAVNSLGPLEYVLNTPKHHRVHHSCNLRSLDKNYGGLLIVWDKLFDTFAEEESEDTLVYGLTFQPQGFNPLYLQLFYNQLAAEKFKSMKGWKNKLLSLIKGPSWTPGSPWTGFLKDKINIKSRVKFDMRVPGFLKVYVAIQFAITLIGFYQFTSAETPNEQPFTKLIYVIYTMSSLTIIGLILENHPKAIFFDVVRCFFGIFFLFYANDNKFLPMSFPASLLLSLSIFFWPMLYLITPYRRWISKKIS